MRLYSTANDGSFDRNRFICCCWRLVAASVAFLKFLLQKIVPPCSSKKIAITYFAKRIFVNGCKN
ncbi:MAG: hypothetical protein LBP59_12450 [Planctomycetaceae bacterium]|nr:hypothetical protein [Planctomycetaceae bacterium]